MQFLKVSIHDNLFLVSVLKRLRSRYSAITIRACMEMQVRDTSTVLTWTTCQLLEGGLQVTVGCAGLGAFALVMSRCHTHSPVVMALHRLSLAMSPLRMFMSTEEDRREVLLERPVN